MALGMGELSLASNLGERLEAYVDVRLDKGENIDDACISLAAVREGAVDSSIALMQTGLSARFDKTAQRIEIRSNSPFNEPAAEFSLSIQCKGALSSYAKVFAVLPDFQAAPVPEIPAAPASERVATPPSTPVVVASTPLPVPTVPLVSTPPVPEKPQQLVATSVKPRNKKSRSPQKPAEFRLQLSGAQLDISRIGKLSAEERELISVQRKLLDEDDQTAHLLAMQYQLKTMSEEIQAIRLKLANLEAPKSDTPVEGNKKPPLSADTWYLILQILAGLLILGLMVYGLRRYQQRRILDSRFVQDDDEKLLDAPKPANESTLNIVRPVRQKQNTVQSEIQLSALPESTNKEEQIVLEEAELYALYGHPDKAIRILLEFLEQFPQSENAWMLLLSIHSSNAGVTEFESAARKFLSHNKNSTHWKTIQALGRTLDKDNELYLVEEHSALWLPSHVTKQRPIGDILIQLGHLSEQDMEHCLAEFDPKQHGRFGNYLLTRRMINHAQLNEALLMQQSGEEIELDSAENADTVQHNADEARAIEEIRAAGNVQDKAFPLDFVIDEHPQVDADGRALEQGGDTEAITFPIEDKPLAFHIDFDLVAPSDKPKES